MTSNASVQVASRHSSPVRIIGCGSRSGSLSMRPIALPFGQRNPWLNTSSRPPRTNVTWRSSRWSSRPHVASQRGQVRYATVDMPSEATPSAGTLRPTTETTRDDARSNTDHHSTDRFAPRSAPAAAGGRHACRRAHHAGPAAMTEQLYFRQLLSGQDFARDDPIAAQMVNFVHLIGDRETGDAGAGDPLFLDGCGRTDLPGGDADQMYESLTQRLAAIPDDTVLYPGHRYSPASSATMGETRGQNYVFRLPTLDQWRRLLG